MTSIWLTGAENPRQHHHLSSEAPRVAFNVAAWTRNYRSSWELAFEPEEWVAWTDSVSSSIEDLADAIECMGTYPSLIIGPEEWSNAEMYLPLWNGEGELPRQFIESGLVVTDRVFKDSTLNRRVLSARKRDSVLGVITGKSVGVNKYDVLVSSAWWSVQKHGETQVWDGNKICRYSATSKSEVRQKHAEDIENLGVDVSAVLVDDPDAVTLLAIRSWTAFEDSADNTSETPPIVTNPVIIHSPESGTEPRVLDTPPGRKRHVLPVISAFLEQSTDLQGVSEENIIIESVHESLRQCNNCYLSDSCPASEPDQSCAYSIPVEIRTKDQLQRTLQAVLEIQTQRVLQARFAEEITGQELSPEVGREMDRMFSLTSKMQDVLDSRDTLRVSLEARGTSAGGGALSRLFGSAVGNASLQLEDAIPSDDILDAVVSG